ncbi:MAG TPA: PKD domain-containing protein [Parafilimonas sp.]|nr:PKD domain-containing protein [Parafilimonas sp.]
MMIKHINCLLPCLFVIFINAAAQNPYVLNGSATQDNCHCYTLTKELGVQSGSIWNKNKIDLTKPFDYFFNVYLGCKDGDGADGIAFVLQPVSTSLGSAGQGLGFGGIVPSLGVTIDTWQNYDDNDPYYDHVDIQANGDVKHNSVNDLTGPVTATDGSPNIEDCKWHVLEVNWQPASITMTVSIDGALRLTLQKDIIASIFNNDPMVFWGFTSATGGAVNLQRMCTSLDAHFVLAPHDNTCIGTPLTFLDSSLSFGTISNWNWNFGDGTTSTMQNPPPHLYASPGVYTVTLNITGGDGCVSDTFKQAITIGTYAAADFKTSLLPICNNRDAVFTDATTLDVGTKNYWYWNFGNGTTSNAQNPPAVNYPVGNYKVRLFVNTKENCPSDTVEKEFTVAEAPNIDFIKNDTCKNIPIQFTAQNLTGAIGINQWYWDFGDNNFATGSPVQHAYSTGGIYNASLVAYAINGCISDTITKPVTIYATNAYAGNDTTILTGYPYRLNASGGDSYAWSPSTGLDNPLIANPVATLYSDITYALTASTVAGCATTDLVHLKVIKGPEIYVPSAFTPNGDGRNDRFRFTPAGISEISFFRIMNRWGQVVYSSENAGDGWDGNLNGIQQPAGTYVWMIAGKTIDGAIIKRQGTLVLIR